jgi:hypothetical protein
LEKKKKAFNQKQERAREYEAIVASSKLGRKLSLFVESAAQKRNRGAPSGSLRSSRTTASLSSKLWIHSPPMRSSSV